MGVNFRDIFTPIDIYISCLSFFKDFLKWNILRYCFFVVIAGYFGYGKFQKIKNQILQDDIRQEFKNTDFLKPDITNIANVIPNPIVTGKLSYPQYQITIQGNFKEYYNAEVLPAVSRDFEDHMSCWSIISRAELKYQSYAKRQAFVDVLYYDKVQNKLVIKDVMGKVILDETVNLSECKRFYLLGNYNIYTYKN